MRSGKWSFVGVRVSLVSLLLLVKIFLCGQIKWDGGAGDGQWSNPVNWTGDILPITGDDVVLDNSFISTSYKVTFTAGNASVTIRSLRIEPSATDSIILELPKTNTISPGLQITGSIYPLLIKNRGTLINASGSTSGASVVLTDSIRIENGGTYIHRTARAHAALVMLLSRAPGTEEGCFWFDVPDVSSTISLSNRTFGKLVLSATAAGGSLNYTAASTQKIRIRSDFWIGAGVKLNLNCSDTLHVARDYIQQGGTLNLSSSTRLLVMAVGGQVAVSTGAILTETGTALPVLLFNGTGSQSILFQGTISNQVIVRLSNGAGAVLQQPLHIPYLFDLKKGRLTTDPLNVLTIQPGGNIKADSLSLASFVNGPLKIEGLNSAYRLFPVGGSNELRWIGLHNATGDFTITHVRADGRLIDSRISGIHHISGQEYWLVRPGETGGNAAIELSFNDANQSGITDLASLHVARLQADGWNDAGNLFTSGSAGGRGSVTGNLQLMPGPGDNTLFALAAANGSQNPLPLNSVRFHVEETPGETIISFDTTGISKVELQQRVGIDSFTPIDSKTSVDWSIRGRKYSFKIMKTTSESIYRLSFFLSDGRVINSKGFLIHQNRLTEDFDAVVRHGSVTLRITAGRNIDGELNLFDMSGRLLLRKPLKISEGMQVISFNIPQIKERQVVLSVLFGRNRRSKIVEVK